MAVMTARSRDLPEWLTLGAGASPLLVAAIAQHAGLVPCALCYLERWPYRVAIALATLSFIGPRLRPVLRPLLILSFLAAAAIALIHVGVEAQWWKSPLPECAAPPLRTGNIRDLLASMPAHPAKPCDDPTYLIPGLPVSMAQMNLAYALAAAGLIAMFTPWQRPPRPNRS